jgi:hypothetical protein
MTSAVLPYDRSAFNDLPTIEVADEEMRSHDRLSLALKVLAPAFLENDMCDSWAISLLHKHWRLEEGEFPILEVQQSTTPRVLVTKPRGAGFQESFTPSVLAVVAGPEPLLRPLEFSAEAHVADAFEKLKNTPQFVRHLGTVILSHNLEQTFGLTAVRQCSQSDLELIEFNYEGRVSIIKETISSEASTMKIIQTSWRFVPSEKGMACVTKCLSGCNVSGGTHTGKYHSPPYHDPNG